MLGLLRTFLIKILCSHWWEAGNKTRLIFHLSFEFQKEEHSGGSVNSCTLKEFCSVHYNDLDAAMASCLEVSQFNWTCHGTQVIFLGKTDLSSAFRVLPLKVGCFCWLILKAEDPRSGRIMYFVEKCLPFGASISCSHYQRFSNALKYIMMVKTGGPGKDITNYLDDFLFIALTRLLCDGMIKEFIKLC